jgi:hypothetical protein
VKEVVEARKLPEASNKEVKKLLRGEYVENNVQKEYEGKVPYSKRTVRVQGVHRHSVSDE